MENKNIKSIVKIISIIFVSISLITVLAVSYFNGGIFYWNKELINGNVLNIPYGATWDDTNLITSPWKNLQFHTGLMYRSLFLADSTLENVECDMVKHYKISDDGLKYEFELKDNLLWSDGEEITIYDVAFSIESVLLANDTNGLYPSAFAFIEGAESFVKGETDHVSGIKVYGNTVTLVMEKTYPTLLQVLAQFVILPKHCLENENIENLHISEFWANPVVSGMYKFGEVVPYKTIQLIQNEYYVGTKPKIEEVMIQLNYKQADLDYHSTNNSTEIINYRSMRGMKEYKADVLFYRYLIFNIEGSTLNPSDTSMKDIKLREALSYAIDSDYLLKNVYFDFGQSIDFGVPRSSKYYDNVKREYDEAKAKALLEESNYDMTRPLKLGYYYTDSVSKYFMESLASNLRKIGFKVELIQLLSPAEIYDIRDYDILLKGLSAFSLNEWYSEYSSTTPTTSKLLGTNAKFETLVKQFLSVPDETSYHETLKDLQKLEQEQLYKLPLFTLSQMVYIRNERVSIPKDVSFGNTWYKYDVDFEKWHIKTEGSLEKVLCSIF